MKIRNKTKSGFTLIEILIVIVIIGILATVVVIALAQSAKEKARIAAGQQLADSMRAAMEEGVYGSNNPGSRWRLDNISGGTVLDEWGNNVGTVSGNPQVVAGVNGNALEFDGTGDWITIASASGLPQGNDPFSISAWVNFDSLPAWKIVTAWGNMGARRTNWFVISSGRLQHINYSNNPADTIRGNTTLSVGSWHHIAVTYDGVTRRFYADGVFDGLNTPQTMAVSGSDLTIAYDANGNGRHYVGSIDEVGIYSEALTVQSIQRIYAESAPKYRMTLK